MITETDLNPVDVMVRLHEIAVELDNLGRDLQKVEQQLEPTERAYEQHMAAHEIGLWQKYLDGNLKKWPGEQLRDRLGHQSINAGVYGQYIALKAERDRMRKRIDTLRASADAQRSVLSALKVEAEATGAGMRR